jgi:hypothetical protein
MLTEIETHALDMLLAGDRPELATLRAQLKSATVAKREFTGAGFFTHFAVPAELPRVESRSRFALGDLYAEVAGLAHAAGFVLFVNDGAIDVLECFIVDDHWPEAATLVRAYYVKPAPPGSAGLVETRERDIPFAFTELSNGR